MNRTELIQEVAKQADLPKRQVERIVNALFSVIKRELARGGKVQVLGFGTFDVRNRAESKVRNPRTGELINLPEHKRPHFTAGKAFKAAVN